MSQTLSSLRQVQTAQAAVFGHDPQRSAPVSFGNDHAAWVAAHQQVAIVDRSDWGCVRVGDSDRLRFLHNQTTNAMANLSPGEGCETVFVTSTARTLDLVTAYVQAEDVLLVTSPGWDQPLVDLMDRYIFFADRVRLTNQTATTAIFSVLGPQSAGLLRDLGVEDLPGDRHHHCITHIQGIEVFIAAGAGLAAGGFTLITATETAAQLWQACTAQGAIAAGTAVWEQLRIRQGRPMPGQELTEETNPLEAGLWHTVSFDKGCYIGQETIARLNTYQGVKQQLWGLKFDQLPDTDRLMQGEEKVGRLTSITTTPDGIWGLGYVRTKAGGVNLTVQAGQAIATVIDRPYLTHGYLTP